jgi:hypothetical protein
MSEGEVVNDAEMDLVSDYSHSAGSGGSGTTDDEGTTSSLIEEEEEDSDDFVPSASSSPSFTNKNNNRDTNPAFPSPLTNRNLHKRAVLEEQDQPKEDVATKLPLWKAAHVGFFFSSATNTTSNTTTTTTTTTTDQDKRRQKDNVEEGVAVPVESVLPASTTVPEMGPLHRTQHVMMGLATVFGTSAFSSQDSNDDELPMHMDDDDVPDTEVEDARLRKQHYYPPRDGETTTTTAAAAFSSQRSMQSQRSTVSMRSVQSSRSNQSWGQLLEIDVIPNENGK